MPGASRNDASYSRRESERLSWQIILGLAVGWLLTIVSAAHYFLVVGASDRLWLILLWVGIGFIVLSVTVPSSLFWLEWAFRRTWRVLRLFPKRTDRSNNDRATGPMGTASGR